MLSLGVDLLRRGQQRLRIGALDGGPSRAVGEKGSRTGKDGCKERGAVSARRGKRSWRIPIGQGWTSKGNHTIWVARYGVSGFGAAQRGAT